MFQDPQFRRQQPPSGAAGRGRRAEGGGAQQEGLLAQRPRHGGQPRGPRVRHQARPAPAGGETGAAGDHFILIKSASNDSAVWCLQTFSRESLVVYIEIKNSLLVEKVHSAMHKTIMLCLKINETPHCQSSNDVLRTQFCCQFYQIRITFLFNFLFKSKST